MASHRKVEGVHGGKSGNATSNGAEITRPKQPCVLIDQVPVLLPAGDRQD